MAYILVVADYSLPGDGAVHYACRMAQDMKCGVTLLHSFIVPIAFTDTPMPVVPMGDAQEIAQGRMNELIAALHEQYPGVVCTADLRYGDTIDVLKEHLGAGDPLLTIIGASAEEGWLDNQASELLRNLDVPVLAVPEGTEYRQVRQICLACDYKDVDEKMPVRALLKILQLTSAALHVLHMDATSETARITFEDTALPRLLGGTPVTYHYPPLSGDLDGSIAAFARQQHMDWLAVIPHPHSFWSGLFHKSHTKAMIHAGKLPVLGLHGDGVG